MANRLFYRGSEVGEVAINETILSFVNECDYTDEQINELTSNFRMEIRNALEELDSRLWWQPETSEIFCEDDESGKPIPFNDDPNGFAEWFSETVSNILLDFT